MQPGQTHLETFSRQIGDLAGSDASPSEAFLAGEDARENGSNLENTSHRFFASPALRSQAMSGITALVICFICKGELRPLKGDDYSFVKGRPRCPRCCRIHGTK